MAFNITPASVISTALTELNLLNSVFKVDVVAILNQETMQQVFASARPMEATVRETAKVMDYPVETGGVVSDFKVINPTEIEYVCIISTDDFNSAYQEIRNAWINSTLLSVQTRTGTYRNMIVESPPHKEDSQMFNAITMYLRLREVIWAAPSSIAAGAALSNYSPTNPRNQMTVNRGLLSPVTAVSGVVSYFRAKNLWGL